MTSIVDTAALRELLARDTLGSYVSAAQYIPPFLPDPFIRHQPPPWEPEPTDEELGWADDDSVPINIYGETEEEDNA